MPDDRDLYIRLLDKVYYQTLTSYLGIKKILSLIKDRYYQKGWIANIKYYINNYQVYKRINTWRDKTPGLLRPLLIPNRLQQHLVINYYHFLRDKNSYNYTFIIVDRLLKYTITIPCHQTITAKGIAKLFIEYIYCQKGPLDLIILD